MSRRDQQIALASALGGGFVDTSNTDAGAHVMLESIRCAAR